MNNKEIRSWAKEGIKGNVGFLLATVFICMLPALLGGFFVLFTFRSLPGVLGWVLSFIAIFMGLGETCVVLRLIQTGEQKLSALFTPLSPDWVGKAFVVALVLSLWSVVQSVLPSEGLMGLVFALVGLAVSTILFPIRYMLFLFPDWPAGKVINEGFRAGCDNFGDLFSFQFVLLLPIFGIVLLMVLSHVFVGVLTIYVIIFGVIALVLYPAYMILAQAKYAMERFMQ